MKIDESTKAAKDYMIRRTAAKMRKDPADLTPEEIAKALAAPLYFQISDMAKAYPNYIPALLKFAFDQGASVQNIEELLQTLQTKKQLLSQIAKSPQDLLDDYSNRPPVNGISGYEQLMDTIRTAERMKEAKWFIDGMPRSIRDQFRSLSSEEKQPFITAAIQLNELGEDAIRRFFAKIKAFDGKPISEVGEYVARYLKGFSNLDLQKKITAIENLEPEAGVIYADDQYLVMSVRTEKAQKDLCDVANWCINRGSFSSYANDAVQLNIFNFGTDSNDPLFLTGTTIYYTGKVRTAHDINDAHIKKSDDPADHFTQLGYPPAVVDSIIKELPREMMIKKVVYDLKLDKNKPIEVLFNIIKQSYSIDPETDPVTLEIVLDIVRTRIKENLSKEEVIKMYSEYGVLSKFSAMLVKELLGDATSDDMKQIVDSTLKVFATVNQIAREDPSLLFPQVKNVLAQEKDVLRELGISDSAVMEKRGTMEFEEMHSIFEFIMAEPAVKPRTAPTIAPTRPMPKRPGPVPSKQPFKAPEPAKAEADDVISRYEELTGKKDEEQLDEEL